MLLVCCGCKLEMCWELCLFDVGGDVEEVDEIDE